MKRKIFVFLAAVLLLSCAFSAKQVEPYSKEISGGELVGRAVPASTMEMFFSRENEKYDSLDVLNSLPSGFGVSVEKELESFRVVVDVPPEAIQGEYELLMRFSDSENRILGEEVNVYFTVSKELIFVSMDNFSKEVLTGNRADFSFVLVNNSDAEAGATINSGLPQSWFSEKSWDLPPASIKRKTAGVTPIISGTKKFDFRVHYGGSEKVFGATVNAIPTIKSKFGSALNGLPFYSFSLVPSYLLNGLLSLFL